jgi:hypothetical protein
MRLPKRCAALSRTLSPNLHIDKTFTWFRVRLLKRCAALSRVLSRTYTLTKPHMVSRAAAQPAVCGVIARLVQNLHVAYAGRPMPHKVAWLYNR